MAMKQTTEGRISWKNTHFPRGVIEGCPNTRTLGKRMKTLLGHLINPGCVGGVKVGWPGCEKEYQNRWYEPHIIFFRIGYAWL